MVHVSIFFPSVWVTPPSCVLSVTLLFALVFLKLGACDDMRSICWLTDMSVFLLGLSCGSGTYRAGPGHQRLPVWLGRLSPSARAGTEEERDGLVQAGARLAGHQARHGAAATETIRPHGWAARKCKIKLICQTCFCRCLSLKGRLECLSAGIIQCRWLCLCIYKTVFVTAQPQAISLLFFDLNSHPDTFKVLHL